MSLFSNWPGATFTRTTEACYLTSATTTAVASANTPRIENIGDGNSYMLFEGQNVNYVGGSEGTAFSGSGAWSGEVGASIDATLQSDPDGGTQAVLLHIPTSSVASIFNTLDSTGSGTGVNADNVNVFVIFWARVASSTGVITVKWQDRSAPANRGATLGTPTLTTTWQRFAYACNTGTGTHPPLLAIRNDGTHAIDFVIFRAGVYISNWPPSDVRNITPDPFPTTSDADVLTFFPNEFWYPLLWKAHQFTFLPKFGSADLNNGDEFWLYSYCGNTDGIRVRKSSGNVLVEALWNGTVRAASNALTFARETALVIKVDPGPKVGQITVNGSAGPAGTGFMPRMSADLASSGYTTGQTATYYATPQLPVRVGGISGGASEAWGRLSEPVAA